ncbi:MAG: hypothetical protein DMD48_08250 [Gemmatimonadetes bacterium]|nr:MAG: hypothetical protein DMD48_08250 [Gemmatimonadota bacterium]
MRTGVVAVALALLVLAPLRPARAQFSFDARRIGMGGLTLSRDGNARRYNPAYRAVKNKNKVSGAPKFSIPVPFGLIQFFKDHPINQLGHDPMFDPKSPAFNPVALMDVIFNPPIFYEIKKAPTPTNDVEFTIGRNQLVVDLGATKVLIPESDFGLGTTSRLFDAGVGFAGFNVGIMGFLQYDVEFALDTTLRKFLVGDTAGAKPNTAYFVNTDGTAQAGLAPTVSFAGRLLRGAGGDETDDGFYLGGALHYYLGATYGRGVGPAGFTTGTPDVFTSTPAPLLNGDLFTSNKPNGHGVGGDVGVVWISGPFEVGAGVNDIGAELTWSDTKVQHFAYDNAGDSITSVVTAPHIETKTKLPITYIANAALHMGTGTTVGGDVVNSGRGTIIHVGAEQRYGPFAVRGGVSRDQRRRMQFGLGGGLKFGSIGLDVGFWTHSNSLSTQRAITLATSISIY